MKRTERNRLINTAKNNIIAGMILVIVISISIAGATLAWFTDEVDTLERFLFEAGTVKLSEPDGYVEPLVASGADVLNEMNLSNDSGDSRDQKMINDLDNDSDVDNGNDVNNDSDADNDSDELIGDDGDGENEEEAVTLRVVIPNTCRTVTWTFSNIGSKDAFVRVRPFLAISEVEYTDGLDITLLSDNWLHKNGWWYYSNNSKPFNVVKPTEGQSIGETVTVSFQYCYSGNPDDIALKLEAHAVQSSNEAYKEVWKGQHPW